MGRGRCGNPAYSRHTRSVSFSTPGLVITDVMIVQGRIDFGVGDERYTLSAGDVVALEGNVIHDLNALEDSIVRLSLHKSDSVARVSGVLKL